MNTFLRKIFFCVLFFFLGVANFVAFAQAVVIKDKNGKTFTVNEKGDIKDGKEAPAPQSLPTLRHN